MYCTISAEDEDTSISTYIIDGVKVFDSVNFTTAIRQASYPMLSLTDFQGDGFPLDGSCSLYDEDLTPSTSGKYGIRTNIGSEGLTTELTLTFDAEVLAVTVTVSSGSGTITANDVSYSADETVVIPVNSTSVTLYIESDDDDNRFEISSITPGIVMEFDRENLISVVLNLRSDTSIKDFSWQQSEIEIQAYWKDDVSTAIANINEDTPITYKAGYDGDYSRTRYFYLTEAATQKEGLLTIKGVDASAKLDDTTMKCMVDLTYRKSARSSLYTDFKKCITDSGITLKSTESQPTATGTSHSSANSIDFLVFEEETARERLANFMWIGHHESAGFWPTFVDAGYPVCYWTPPTVDDCNRGYGAWTIYEEDCADHEISVERQINKIASDDSNGLTNKATRSSTKTLSSETSEEKGEIVTVTADEYVQESTYSITNSPTIISYDAKEFVYKTKKADTTYKLTGRKISITEEYDSITPTIERSGETLTINPVCYGHQYITVSSSKQYRIYPNYQTLFDRSNITGTFTWKGDPRMQPRDLFYLVYKNGTSAVCTIESIELVHEAGGTMAEITYRKGIC